MAARINAVNLHKTEPPFRFVAECPREEIDASPEFFKPAASLLNQFDQLRVFCPDPKGFWVRTYWVVSTKPFYVAAEGNWKRVSRPEEVKPQVVVGRTERQVFVPVGCDPGDIDEHGYLKGKPLDLSGPLQKKFEVRGLGTNRLYKETDNEEEAWLVMRGQKPYSVESMERTA